MKAYLYDKLKSKVATVIRKNIEFEYSSSYESEQTRGLSTTTWVVKPERKQAEIAAEKILTLLDITRDEKD